MQCYITRVGSTWPAGHMRPSKGKSAAPEHFYTFNEMRPSKGNSAALERLFAALEHVNPKLILDILDLRMKS